jgi:hypothetical protein
MYKPVLSNKKTNEVLKDSTNPTTDFIRGSQMTAELQLIAEPLLPKI